MLALSLLLSLPFAPSPTLAAPAHPVHEMLDEADDQAQYIAGLFAEEHFELVVKEARQFLKQQAQHKRRPLVQYRLASALFELGQAPAAVPHYRTLGADASFEYQAEALLRLGQCELQGEQPERAKLALEAALAGEQDYLKPTAAFFLGEANFQLQDYPEARAQYRACLRSRDASTYHAHARRGLAWCSFRESDWKACRKAAQEFLRAHGEHELAEELRFLLGDAAYQAEDYEAADQAWRGIESAAWAPAALRGRAWVASKQGNDRGAATLFARLLQSDPSGRFAQGAALQSGVHLLRAEEPADALAALEHKAAGEGPEVLYWRAKALRATGASEPALEMLTRASRGADEDLKRRIATTRGDLLFDLGRLDESAAAYGSDQSDYALHAGATASLNAGRPEKALLLTEQFLSKYPESSYELSTRIVRAEALFVMQKYAVALEDFSSLTKRRELEATQASSLQSRLAWCQFLLNDFSAAASSFERLCTRFPKSSEASEARYMQGRACSQGGAIERAVAVWSSYLEEYPQGEKRADVMLQLTRLTGDPDTLRQLLRELPDHGLAPSALLELAEHESQTGDTGKAIASYRGYLARYPDQPGVDQARYSLAWELRASGDPQGARKELLQLFQDTKSDDLILSGLELGVWCASDLASPKECEQMWNAFAARCSDEPQLLSVARVASQAWREAGKGKEARNVLAKLKGRLKDPEVQLSLQVERVWCAIETQAFQEAESLTTVSLKTAPKDSRVLEAAFFVGEECFARSEFDRASEFYAFATHPSNGELVDEALYKLGFSQLSLEQSSKAALSFEQLVLEHAQSDLFAESLYLAGEARYREGDMLACRKHMERFRKQIPRHAVRPKVLHRLGLSANATGEPKLANQALTELLTTTPDFPQQAEARYEQGLALIALDRKRAGRASMEAVVSKKDKSAGDNRFAARARLALGELDVAAGDLDSALSHFLKVSMLYADGEEVRDAKFLAAGVLEAQGDQRLAIKKYQELQQSSPESRQGKAAAKRLRELGRE